MSDESPITFTEPSFALLDVELNAVLTTAHGNLAIFSVKSMAELWAKASDRKVKVVKVWIHPAVVQ